MRIIIYFTNNGLLLHRRKGIVLLCDLLDNLLTANMWKYGWASETNLSEVGVVFHKIYYFCFNLLATVAQAMVITLCEVTNVGYSSNCWSTEQ